MPNADEIRWNVNAYLAYGFKALSYFNYVMWGGESCYDGLIDREGNILHQELYDQVSSMNWEIRSMSDLLMNLDCLHAYHTQNDVADVEVLPENWIVTPADSSDLILSYMRAKDGTEPYLAVFNKSFESEVEQTFILDEGSGITGLEAYNPATKQYDAVAIENGTFTLSLAKSELKFLRLKGKVVLPA